MHQSQQLTTPWQETVHNITISLYIINMELQTGNARPTDTAMLHRARTPDHLWLHDRSLFKRCNSLRLKRPKSRSSLSSVGKDLHTLIPKQKKLIAPMKICVKEPYSSRWMLHLLLSLKLWAEPPGDWTPVEHGQVEMKLHIHSHATLTDTPVQLHINANV